MNNGNTFDITDDNINDINLLNMKSETNDEN